MKFLKNGFFYLDTFFILGLVECFSTLISINVDKYWLNNFISNNVEAYFNNYLKDLRIIRIPDIA
jgi:hypothetical protein